MTLNAAYDPVRVETATAKLAKIIILLSVIIFFISRHVYENMDELVMDGGDGNDNHV